MDNVARTVCITISFIDNIFNHIFQLYFNLFQVAQSDLWSLSTLLHNDKVQLMKSIIFLQII